MAERRRHCSSSAEWEVRCGCKDGWVHAWKDGSWEMG